jgi:hypothetical protein
MSKDKKTTKKTEKAEKKGSLRDRELSTNKTVTWRLPVRVAEDNEGSWTPFREHLEKWREAGCPGLDPEVPEETKHVGLRVSPELIADLEKEAERLSKETGKRWTAGRVAREVWDTWEPA